MTLDEALEKTGCAIQRDQQVTIAIEHLVGEECLLTVRRGMSMLQCNVDVRPVLEAMLPMAARNNPNGWKPATVAFVEYARF